jgi:low affinity Fe/Cu permease
MVSAIVKIILGLFVWMVLPRLIYNKRKYQKNTPQFFINISSKIIGIAMIVFAIKNLIRSLLSF